MHLAGLAAVGERAPGGLAATVARTPSARAPAHPHGLWTLWPPPLSHPSIRTASQSWEYKEKLRHP